MQLREKAKKPTQMSHFSNRRYRKKSSLRIKILTFLIGFAISTATLGASVVWFFQKEQPMASEKIDVNTTLHSILIDSSDPLSKFQQEQVSNLLGRISFTKFKKNDRVLVAALNDQTSEPIQFLFNEIDPGKADEANILYETPKMIDEKRNKTFFNQYTQAISKAQVPVKRPQTPLLAGIEVLSKHANFQNDFQESAVTIKKTLLIVTDGLENAEISAYKGNIYGKKGLTYINNHIPSLEGVDVTIAYIYRQNYRHLQGEKHKDWLRSTLINAGASSVKFIDIL
jgi:hypothetical protein